MTAEIIQPQLILNEETTTPVGIPKQGEIPEELKPYIPQAQQFIDSHVELFHTIAQDRSLRFKPGVGFYIDLKEGEVSLDLKSWKNAAEQGESDWQILWSVCHEIGHFTDLREDPEGMLGGFDHMQKKAKELTPVVRSVWERRFGQLPEGLDIEAYLYQQIHGFYNSLDDIYDNRTIAERASPFGEHGSQAHEVTRLYQDILFPTDPRKPGVPPRELEAADYAKLPKSMQLGYTLLRSHMVPGQAILLDPAVQQRLDGYADEVAERLGVTLKDEVATLTSPANQKARKPGWRYAQIQRALEPVFTELLLQDIEEQPLPPIVDVATSGKGEKSDSPQGEPQEEDNSETNSQEDQAAQNPWTPLNQKSEPLSKEAVEDFIKQQREKENEQRQIEQEAKRKARLTPEDRAHEARSQTDRVIAEEHAVDPRFAREYRALEESVDPYKRELAQVFEQLMNTISSRITTFWTEGFRSGKFNTDRFIAKYGSLVAADRPDLISWDRLDVYDQKEILSRLVLFPDNIRVRMVLDGSGSMDQERILALKQLSVLFFEGLSTFEETMKLRFRLKDPLHVDTQVTMFGSPGQSKVVKDFAHDKPDYRAELASRFAALSEINSGYGGTCDAEPFWMIADDITPKLAADLHANKAKEFVFEITDGGSNSPSARAGGVIPAQDTRNAVEAVEQKGAIARAFQVGTPSEEEVKTFESIWGNNGERIAHPKDLVPAMAKLLANELLSTQFQLQYYEEDEI